MDQRPGGGRPEAFRVWLFRVFLLTILGSTAGLGLLAVRASRLTAPAYGAASTHPETNPALIPPSLTPAPPAESFDPSQTLGSEFGTLILALRLAGRTHLHAYLPGSSAPIPLSDGDWDDRDPALSPDGRRLAFASDREGGWDLFLLELESGATRRLTDTAGYEGHPVWSPDGSWLAYESYQSDNFDIWILRLDGTQAPLQLTGQSSLEISPSWDPRGRRIAFVSDRDGGPDVLLADLDDLGAPFENLTRSPNEAEADPAFSPDGGRLAFVTRSRGFDEIRVLDTAEASLGSRSVGQGRDPAWSPEGDRLVAVLPTPYDGSSLVVYGTSRSSRPSVPLPTLGIVERAVWTASPLPGGVAASAGPGQAALAAADSNPAVGLGMRQVVEVPGLRAPHPMLSDAVAESFLGLRDRTAAELGWDFLAQLEYAFVGLNDALPPGFQYNDWLYTGRGFAFTQGAVEAGWVELVREDFAGQTYWRVFVRTLLQDGTQGEPLRARPWDFRARRNPDPLAYDQGGGVKPEIPRGYYLDFTRMAADFSFQRLPALANWRTYLPGARFNEFVKTDGLSWEQAMLELYPPGAIATPTEFRTPTSTPTRTPWPSPTPWWWRWTTPTPSATTMPDAYP